MASLKHILDIVRCLHLYGAQISFEKLLQRARAEHQYGMVVMALSVVYRLMPHLSRLKAFGEVRTWFPWNQKLAWRKEEDYRHFRSKGLTYYVHQILFSIGKLDHPRYRFLFLWRMFFPHPEMIRVYLGRPSSESNMALYTRWIGRFWTMKGNRARQGHSPDILLQGDDQ
jgi:hypothetical protein